MRQKKQFSNSNIFFACAMNNSARKSKESKQESALPDFCTTKSPQFVTKNAKKNALKVEYFWE
jgi:hypothetical protein